MITSNSVHVSIRQQHWTDRTLSQTHSSLSPCDDNDVGITDGVDVPLLPGIKVETEHQLRNVDRNSDCCLTTIDTSGSAFGA